MNINTKLNVVATVIIMANTNLGFVWKLYNVIILTSLRSDVRLGVVFLCVCKLCIKGVEYHIEKYFPRVNGCAVVNRINSETIYNRRNDDEKENNCGTCSRCIGGGDDTSSVICIHSKHSAITCGYQWKWCKSS